MNEIKNESILFLTSIESIGYKAIDKLLYQFGSYDEIFKLSDSEILMLDIINNSQKRDFINARKNWNLDRYLAYMNKHNINLITKDDSIYPKKLLKISDPPFQLFYVGELPDENIPSVSIIGARNCSDYGINCAKYFAAELGKRGIQVISGLASGIDGISQKAAIDAGGNSYGILGCGADICYPRSNWRLFEELKNKGGIISEFPPGTKAISRHFVMRNRIISGLADIVLVIEAKEKSGTLITVSMALEQGKEVYAVPGRITDRLSDGCNKLIVEGAGVARCVDDILDALQYMNVVRYEKTDEQFKYNVMRRISNDSEISKLLKDILEILLAGSCHIDDLYKKLSIVNNELSFSDVQVACMELEMKDYISIEQQIAKVIL